MASTASREVLMTSLKSQLVTLRERIKACKTVHDYVTVTKSANAVARQAAAECAAHAMPSAEQQPSTSASTTAKAAALAGAPAAPAASARSVAASPLSLLPSTDDGVSAMLLRLPKGWGEARVAAYVERFGPKPAKVSKEAGESHSLLVYADAASRAAFQEAFAQQAAAQPASSNGAFVLRLPSGGAGGGGGGGLKRGSADAEGGAGGVNGNADGGRPVKQQRTDIRDVVSPWWSRPYKEQLDDKMTTVERALRLCSERVARTYGREEKPAWLATALRRSDKVAVPLPGIIRSPQLEGYRNKAEFTIGLDTAERPIAGFLAGNYVDGITHVSDPAGCRHMTPASLALAAATTAFMRSADCTLPAWDKRCNKGFWRLLTVREGRSSTFLPLPAAGAASAGGEQPLPSDCCLSDLPLQRWLVRNPRAQAGAVDELVALLKLPDGGLELPEVTEAEPAAPPPSEIAVMVQVHPGGAPSGEEQIQAQLAQLEAALGAAAAAGGLPAPLLLVQEHVGVANAAPQDAPVKRVSVAAATPGERDTFGDALCDARFRVSPTAFFQVNAGAACLLYSAVGRLACVDAHTLLLDICCGTGTIGLSLAARAGAVVGIDSVPSAIEDASANAALNGVKNARYVCGPAESVIDDVLAVRLPSLKGRVLLGMKRPGMCVCYWWLTLC